MRLLPLCILFLLAFTSQAQDITLYKTFGGVRFERDSLIISARQVQYILTDNTEALDIFKKARTNSGVASILGFAGGVLIGFPLGTALVGGEPEWGLALSGAALLVVSIPFNKAFQRHAQTAVDTYNQDNSSRLRDRTEFFLAGSGAGIRLRF